MPYPITTAGLVVACCVPLARRIAYQVCESSWLAPAGAVCESTAPANSSYAACCQASVRR